VSDIAIRVENLSKAYRIGLAEQRHDTLMGAVTSFVRSPFENYRNLRKLSRFNDALTYDKKQSIPDNRKLTTDNRPSDIIWALRNVSFEVKHGEVVGIIGRNGAGKSTLLKILSRITEPTRGRALVYGRVASLLEVGTGMHIELTGRENIYLMGTILGMSKKEVDRKFDEIVSFAEVEKFIDTPFKRYSSGMRLRLAFSVAAHLEPEILIIDEVLAVGDLSFQRKCLGKMDEVAQQGRTVLFVSHNMAAVVQLCQRSLVLAVGEVKFDATSSQSVDFYVRSNSADDEDIKKANGVASFADLRVNGSIAPTIGLSEPFDVSVTLRGAVDEKLLVALILEDASGTRIFHDRWTADDISKEAPRQDHSIEVSVPNLSLAPGLYSVFFGASFISSGKPAQIVSERLPLKIRGDSDHLGRTLLVPKIEWRLKAR
jgi:lipopolysaccharide transport system ATP-binding protein